MRSWKRVSPSVSLITLCCAIALTTVGCGAQTNNSAPSKTAQSAGFAAQATVKGTYVTVQRSAYDTSTEAVTLWVHPVRVLGWKQFFSHNGPAGESVIDTSTEHGVANYAVSEYPHKSIRSVHLIYIGANQAPRRDAEVGARVVTATRHSVPVYQQANAQSRVVRQLELGEDAQLVTRVNRSWYQVSIGGQTGYVTANPNLVRLSAQTSVGANWKYIMPKDLIEPPSDATIKGAAVTLDDSAVPTLAGSSLPPGAARSGSVPLPPPGTSFDHSIPWRASATASVASKENAVISVARSKLGTPYIWGHNEDRGQYGFDCSNYTSYVYHHALGYRMTGSSRGQALHVGVPVPRSDMRVGDLLIFESGKHCGIYAGNQRMIQEGGGLGKCGYLSIGPGSYWGKHLTSVKRMF